MVKNNLGWYANGKWFLGSFFTVVWSAIFTRTKIKLPCDRRCIDAQKLPKYILSYRNVFYVTKTYFASGTGYVTLRQGRSSWNKLVQIGI